MTIVHPDGPSPCDLVVVGEGPSHAELEQGVSFVGPSGRILWRREAGDMGLIDDLCARPRSTVYVSNVCKVFMPDEAWKELQAEERERYVAELRAEVAAVQPKVVLAFGRRASLALVPQFASMPSDHGKPTLGYGGKYVAMALWHPAAYLRGNRDALGAIVTDLLKVPTLLVCDGLVELMRPPRLPPEPTWPAAIAFLAFDGPRKTGKCRLCSAPGVASYRGDGLEWKLCMPHAIQAAEWAKTHIGALREHRDIAVADAANRKRERVAAKMQDELMGVHDQTR